MGILNILPLIFQNLSKNKEAKKEIYTHIHSNMEATGDIISKYNQVKILAFTGSWAV